MRRKEMKRHLTMLVVLVASLALATPAIAAVEFKYGGQYRIRAISDYGMVTTDNLDGTTDRNRNFIDTRLRLYFNFVASENLRLVTKFEVGDTVWGNPAAVGRGSGGGVGADGVNFETKNAYVEFGIPQTPIWASVGIQGIKLLDSWIIDDDFSAAVLRAKFDPIGVHLGYIGKQNLNVSDESANIDALFLSVDYNDHVGPGALHANVVGYWQYGHKTAVSAFPAPSPFVPTGQITPAGPIPAFPGIIDNNNLFDLGFKLAYSMDWMSAYLTFVKNLGKIEIIGDDDAKYQGWMIDAGMNFYHGPYTMNVGGFYTSGQAVDDDSSNIKQFTYPLGTYKYFSQIMGGGILDSPALIGHRDPNGALTGQWTGFGTPSNLWTITVGGAWQALDATKVSASYWYWGASERVENRDGGTSRDIGHELNLILTQGIVDGLNLDLVGAVLFTGDAYSAEPSGNDDVYQVGARLLWNF